MRWTSPTSSQNLTKDEETKETAGHQKTKWLNKEHKLLSAEHAYSQNNGRVQLAETNEAQCAVKITKFSDKKMHFSYLARCISQILSYMHFYDSENLVLTTTHILRSKLMRGNVP